MAPDQLTSRGRRTRVALLEAAREVFEETGLRNARIVDITKRAGASYGSFYRYFASKEAILSELLTTVVGEMFTASQVSSGTVADDPVAKIEAANRQYLAAYRRNVRLMAVIEELAIRDPAFRQLKLDMRAAFLRRNEAGIRRLQERGLADLHLDPPIAASMLGGMIEHLSQMWFLHGVAYDEDVAVSTVTRLWAQAIGLQRVGGRVQEAPLR